MEIERQQRVCNWLSPERCKGDAHALRISKVTCGRFHHASSQNGFKEAATTTYRFMNQALVPSRMFECRQPARPPSELAGFQYLQRTTQYSGVDISNT
jgi:hypothetical protein